MTTLESGWKPFKLDELGFVGRGRSRHRPRNEPSLYGGPYPFFQTGEIKAADFHLTKYEQTYNEKGLAQSKLWEPGTLCITIAANIAETAILGIKGCFPDSVVGFIANPDKSDVRFIKYYIDTIKMRMVNVSKGTTQDNLSLDKLLSFDFVVPEVDGQRKIASVLSAYDELIENNTRRIAILEEMAQALYREWFVRFRYPGHENVPLTDDTPSGWNRSALANCASFLSGGTPSKSRADYWQGHIPWISSGELTAMRVYDSSLHLTEEGSEAGSRLVPRETTLVVVRGMSLAKEFRMGMVSREVAFNQDLKALVARPGVDPYLLFHSLREQRDQIRDRATEATHGTKKLDTRVLEQLPIMLPEKGLQRSFREHVEPLHLLWDKLSRKIELLRRARDLLLPKLISGQLDVEQLDIDVGKPVTA